MFKEMRKSLRKHIVNGLAQFWTIDFNPVFKSYAAIISLVLTWASPVP